MIAGQTIPRCHTSRTLVICRSQRLDHGQRLALAVERQHLVKLLVVPILHFARTSLASANVLPCWWIRVIYTHVFNNFFMIQRSCAELQRNACPLGPCMDLGTRTESFGKDQ